MDKHELKRNEIAVNRVMLKEHCNCLRNCISDMNKIMKLPSNEERGKKIAGVMNRIDTLRQSAERYMLGRSWKQISSEKLIR